MNETKLTRFTVRERVVHWLVVLGFLYAAHTSSEALCEDSMCN
jgi:cytochrome b subunit of formate dehydrogenase